MRRTLLALPFALLPLSLAQAASHEHAHDHDHAHEEHGSLGVHEHGVASLNVALDGQTLEIQLESPAMNLVGFEHEARSDADKAKVAAARKQLEQPQELFTLPLEAKCALQESQLESPLFGDAEHTHEGHEHGDEHGHSDIGVSYRFTCANAAALQTLELGSFFGSFPGTEKLEVQLIGPSGQQGAEMTPGNSRLSF